MQSYGVNNRLPLKARTKPGYMIDFTQGAMQLSDLVNTMIQLLAEGFTRNDDGELTRHRDDTIIELAGDIQRDWTKVYLSK